MNARTIQRDVFRACIVTATLGIVLVLGWTLPLERPIADLFMRLANVMSSADSQVAAVVIAIASGATVLSHVNDSGFWLVSRYLGMSEPQTLRVWTVMETLVGLTGFAVVLVVSLFI